MTFFKPHEKWNNNLLTKPAFRRIVTHTVCWLLYIVYELSLFYYSGSKLQALIIYVVFYTFNICLFYCHVTLLNFTIGRQAQPGYWKALALFGGELLIFQCFKSLAEFFIYFDHDISLLTYDTMRNYAILDIYRSIFFAALATLYWSAGRMGRFQRKAIAAEIRQLSLSRDHAELEARLARTHNAYLQQQLNPHLLFNTLGFIYLRVYQQSEEAAACVLLLSGLMRFSLEETDSNGKVLVADEIEQLKNLITLNRYRFHHPLTLDCSFEGDFERYRIIPLVLLTLTENIFKHGDLKDNASTLRLQVGAGGLLRYYSSNFKNTGTAYDRHRAVGINHVKLRLNYAYPDHYHLTIKETETLFQLTLTIQL
jgi:two-component system LytT family sensor kinase